VEFSLRYLIEVNKRIKHLHESSPQCHANFNFPGFMVFFLVLSHEGQTFCGNLGPKVAEEAEV